MVQYWTSSITPVLMSTGQSQYQLWLAITQSGSGRQQKFTRQSDSAESSQHFAAVSQKISGQSLWFESNIDPSDSLIKATQRSWSLLVWSLEPLSSCSVFPIASIIHGGHEEEEEPSASASATPSQLASQTLSRCNFSCHTCTTSVFFTGSRLTSRQEWHSSCHISKDSGSWSLIRFHPQEKQQQQQLQAPSWLHQNLLINKHPCQHVFIGDFYEICLCSAK